LDAAQTRYQHVIAKRLWKAEAAENKRMVNVKRAMAATPNPNAFKYNANDSQLLVRIQAAFRGVLCRNDLKEGRVVPPGPAAAQERLALVEASRPLCQAVHVMLEELRDSTLEAGQRSYTHDEMEATLPQCRDHALSMQRWTLLQPDAAEIMELCKELEVSLHSHQRSLVGSSHRTALRDSMQQEIEAMLGQGERPSTAAHLKARRDATDSLSTPATGADLVMSRQKEAIIWEKMVAGAALESGSGRVSSAVARARMMNVARPDAKDVAPPQGSLDLPPPGMSGGDTGFGSLSLGGLGALGGGFGFASASLLFGEVEVTGGSGESPLMQHTLTDTEASMLRETIDSVLEEAVEGDGQLFTPRQPGEAAEEAALKAEERARSMLAMLNAFVTSEAVQQRQVDIGIDRLAQVQSYLHEGIAKRGGGGAADGPAAQRVAEASATMRTCEGLLEALATLNEGRLGTSRPASRARSSQGSRGSRPRTRASSTRGSGRPTPSRPLSRATGRPVVPEEVEKNVFAMMAAGAHGQHEAQKKQEHDVQKEREKDIFAMMTAGAHGQAAAPDGQQEAPDQQEEQEAQKAREKNIFAMMSAGAHGQAGSGL